MAKTGQNKKRYGLIGKNISYSFSKGYFTKKFLESGLQGHTYENFDLPNSSELENLLKNNHLNGLNVTIPYKEAVIPYLDDLDATAAEIGAVNTIKFIGDKRIGFNTDAHGFQMSLSPLLNNEHDKALILGTGGASKAIAYVLDRCGIRYTFVSRNPERNQLGYHELDASLIHDNTLIINCTPLGTHPNIAQKPVIPYTGITPGHILYDLIYNPEKTAFLKAGEAQGAIVKNGLEMLQLQAEKAWEIWNS